MEEALLLVHDQSTSLRLELAISTIMKDNVQYENDVVLCGRPTI